MYDSSGKIRYFLGAQVDISDLVSEGTDLESLQRLLAQTKSESENGTVENEGRRDEFQQLSEMLDIQELNAVRKWGGRMLTGQKQESGSQKLEWRRPGLLLRDPSRDHFNDGQLSSINGGKLTAFYQNVSHLIFLPPPCPPLTLQYLLVRPYPSLRILFASPSQRVPGILQSPLMNRIGGSARVRDELTQALAEGRGVTAKVRWLSRPDEDGRNRWIHCTPLIGSNGQIGVWMLVMVDDDQDDVRRLKHAPPVVPTAAHVQPTVSGRDYAADAQEDWTIRPELTTGARNAWAQPSGIPERKTEPADWNLDPLRRNRTNDQPDTEDEEEVYQTLEERLQAKRRLEASRMYDHPGAELPIRRTYKSLSPYPFSLE